MHKSLSLVLAALMTAGCTHAVKPVSAPAVNIYTSYGDKVPGWWVLVLDDGVDFQREISPSSYECSAHKYAIGTDGAVASSVRSTFEQVFETVEVRSSAPTVDEMKNGGIKGYAVVRLTDFIPRLTCSSSFWSVNCTARAEINFSVEISTAEGKLLSTTVGGNNSADGSAGGACGKAGEVMSEAMRLGLQDALERMAERVSNAPKLRG